MIKNILKGAVMGIANIIPGVSGGTMAVSMGIYDKIIHAVTHLFSEFKQSMKVLVPIGIGIVLAIVAVARLIEYMFQVVPFQTNLLFIGLILGGLPAMWKKVKPHSIRISYIIAFLLFFALVAGCASLEGSEGSAADLSFSLVNVVKLMGVGVIASATMVVPGVSGSMILMILGYYEPVLGMVNQFVDHLKDFDVEGLISDCGVLIPFGVGVVVGIIVIAKIIEIIFANWPLLAYWAIIGLILASPVAILMMNQFGKLELMTIVTGIGTLAVGIVASLLLGGEEEKETDSF